MSPLPVSPLPVSPLDPFRLAALLTEHRSPVVLDVRHRLGGRSARPDHDGSHIPGAVFLDLDADLAAPPVPGG